MSNTGELVFTDDEEDQIEEENILPNVHPGYPMPKRRVGKINTGRSRFNRQNAGSVMDHRPRQHHILRRTSSADTDTQLMDETNDSTFGKSKNKSASEFSLNHSPKRMNNNELDNVVEFIQKLTSSRSMSSDKKLQYVSELILNLDLEDNDYDGQPKRTRRRYSPSAKIIRKVSKRNLAADRKPPEEISDLNRRLCRSLDNIVDIEFGSNSDDHKNELSKSMLYLPYLRHIKKPVTRKDNEISILHETNEMSSRESINSIDTDGGSSRAVTGACNSPNDSKPPCAFQDKLIDQGNKISDIVPNAESYIIFHKHSRERSIDCTPSKNSDQGTETGKHSGNVDEKSKDGFKRRSVTRIASMYKKRQSWNVANKFDYKDGDDQNSDLSITTSELRPLYQDGLRKVSSATSVQADLGKNVTFDELDFTSGIFGSAPRKSMLSLSTDLGYDSQQDHTQTDEHSTKEPVSRTVSGGGVKDRRNSITCGTSVLKLRKISSSEQDVNKTSHILHSQRNFKEYEV